MHAVNHLPRSGLVAITASLAACTTIPSGRTGVEWTPTHGTINRILDRTRQEAERRRIEAAGIADYQSTISKGLTDKILVWQGIEATEKLAESPNAKVVVIGSGKDGLPLILNAASATPAVAKNSP